MMISIAVITTTTTTTATIIHIHIWQSQGVATFNDDIQSTGAATLAAVLGATRLPGVPALPQQRFLLYGAGQANIGAAQLLQHRLQQQGMSPQDAKSHLWLFDSQVWYPAGPAMADAMSCHATP